MVERDRAPRAGRAAVFSRRWIEDRVELAPALGTCESPLVLRPRRVPGSFERGRILERPVRKDGALRRCVVRVSDYIGTSSSCARLRVARRRTGRGYGAVVPSQMFQILHPKGWVRRRKGSEFRTSFSPLVFGMRRNQPSLSLIWKSGCVPSFPNKRPYFDPTECTIENISIESVVAPFRATFVPQPVSRRMRGGA